MVLLILVFTFNAVDISWRCTTQPKMTSMRYIRTPLHCADSLKNDKIDAAFITAGAPTTAISDLTTSKQAYLVSMDEEHIAKLQETSPYYAESVIPAGTYNGMEEDCTTVAVLAVILANDSVDQDAIYNFTKSIFDGCRSSARCSC